MSRPMLLVDGRVLDDDHPGVRRFWVPILCAWAALGGQGLVAHRRGAEPDSALTAASFAAVELWHAASDPLGIRSTRRLVRATTAMATLSPLYLTVDGAPRNVATVFDLIGRAHPRSWRARLMWEAAMRRTIRTASRVACATTAAARELERFSPRLQGRTAIVSPVAPSAPHPHPELIAGLDLGSPYALIVASHRPHKRLTALAAAWRAAAPPVPLVIVGAGTHQLHAAPIIRGLGFVTDGLVDALLASASCLISASLAEGFGLPVLAALAAGVPVIATRHAALEEVAGNAAQWCEPEDLRGLVVGAMAVAADPARCADQVTRGRLRAHELTAQRSAQQLARVLES